MKERGGEEAPTRFVGGDCMRAFAATGRVVLMEVRPDGTPGMELHIPLDEFDEKMIEEFETKILRKQARQRVTLMR